MRVAAPARLPYWGLLIGAWLLCVGFGFAALLRYSSAPGQSALGPERWPTASALELAADRPTLILFAHPRCACTRATLSELARLLASVSRAPRVYVAFYVPEGAQGDADWTRSDLWQSAALLPGARVVADRGGVEATRFGAATSGSIFLYDPSARRRYAGGITASRGHEGDSFGRRRLLALLNGERADRSDSPVFGCGLTDSERGAP